MCVRVGYWSCFLTRHMAPAGLLSTDASLGMLPIGGSFFPGWRLVKAAVTADRQTPETKNRHTVAWRAYSASTGCACPNAEAYEKTTDRVLSACETCLPMLHSAVPLPWSPMVHRRSES